MKNRNTLILLVFFTYSISAFGQLELKADPVGLLIGDRFNFSAEFNITHRVAIEAGVSYYWGPLTINSRFGAFAEEYAYEEIRPAIFVKFFSNGDGNHTGFQLGPYFIAEIETHREDQYDIDFRNEFGFDPNFTNVRKLGFGFFIAYKWIFWDRLVLQPLIGFDINLQSAFRDKVTDIGGDQRMMVGYRF